MEGQPQASVWTGLKLRGKPRVDIAAWRCRNCGFLEQYAAGGPNRYEASQKKAQLVIVAIAVAVALLAGGAAALLAALAHR